MKYIWVVFGALFLVAAHFSFHSSSAEAQGFASSAKQPSTLTTTATDMEAFTLGPEDIIEISVWGSKEMTSEMPVRPDGLVAFPLIGDVRAKGRTPTELRKEITVRLRKFITDASVTVIVKEINSIKISITGEVDKAGTFKVNRPISLLHLFSLAEGFTEKADLKKSYLLRDGKKMAIDFHALVREDDFSQNVILKDNDFVLIHDNFDSRINVMGEVKKPQVVDFRAGITILDAILMAEGLTDIARPQAAKVYRRIPNSSGKKEIKRISVPLDEVIFEGDLTKNIRLKPGDIIHIPRSFF